MSRASKLAKNTLILSIGTFLPKLATFITLPILTGYLTKSEYGTYDLIIVLASLFLPSVTLQVQTAAFRFLIDSKDKKDDRNSIVTNIFAFIIPISVISLLILYFCLYKLSLEVKIIICLYYLFDMLVSVARQVVRGLSKNFNYSISAIISSVMQIVLVVLFVWKFKQGLLGGIMALGISELISFVYLCLSSGIYKYFDLKLTSKSKLKALISYSWPMVPNSISMWVMRVSDRLVLTFYMNVAANAVYSVANKIPQLLTLAQSTFTMAWQENASIVSKDDDADAYYSSMFKLIFDLMAGFFGIIMAASPVLFILIIRGDYSDAYVHIPILLLAMFFYSMSSFLGGIYVAYMKTKSVGITTLVAAIINLVTDIACVNYIGIFAASGSTLISYIFLYFFRLIDVKKLVNLTYSKKHMVLVIIIIMIESVLCLMNNFYMNILNLIISVVVFWALNKGFVKMILVKMILNKVKKKFPDRGAIMEQKELKKKNT